MRSSENMTDTPPPFPHPPHRPTQKPTTNTKQNPKQKPQPTKKNRQGPDGDDDAPRESMLVVSEFVGCSPSLSGAIRVNPWSVEAVSDGVYAALRASAEER